jgi:hypothetical protein
MKAASGTASWPCFPPTARFRPSPKAMACRCGLRRWSCTGRDNGAHAGWHVGCMCNWGSIVSSRRAWRGRVSPHGSAPSAKYSPPGESDNGLAVPPEAACCFHVGQNALVIQFVHGVQHSPFLAAPPVHPNEATTKQAQSPPKWAVPALGRRGESVDGRRCHGILHSVLTERPYRLDVGAVVTTVTNRTYARGRFIQGKG